MKIDYKRSLWIIQQHQVRVSGLAPRAAKEAPQELFSELYPELINACKKASSNEGLTVISEAEHILVSPQIARDEQAASDGLFALECFRKLSSKEFLSERRLVMFFEQAFFIIDDFERPLLNSQYVKLLARFFVSYNLRYRIIEPFQIIPRLPELYVGMLDAIEQEVSEQPHLLELHNAMKEAFNDLCTRGKPTDVSACIARTCNLAEGLAKSLPEVTSQTLGEATKEIRRWPHKAIQKTLTSLYGFCSDYPGVRHAGNPNGRIRDLEVRDGVIVSMLLIAFTGYLCNIDFDEVVGLQPGTSL